MSVDPLRRAAGIRSSAAGPRLAPLLLLAALAAVLLFDDGRGWISGDWPLRGHVTANHLTVAANLSAEHRFLGFYSRTLNAGGDVSYRPYNRFPVLGHAIVKLVILPFPDDLAAQTYAAQLLMLAFLAGAAALAWRAMTLITSCPWTALTATLAAFSSFRILYHGDMVATEGVVDLFAVMLTFHGMAVFGATGRFAQLAAKSCAALLLGWHVYALLAPFVVLGLAGAVRDRSRERLRSCLTLGGGALLFGAAVLASNFAREQFALGGESALTELPSVQSMLYRTGLAGLQPWPLWSFTEPSWAYFLAQQLARAGLAALPWALAGWLDPLIWDDSVRDLRSLALWAALGAAATALAVGLAAGAPRCRAALAALALSGFCWALLVRFNVHEHEFEGMFHVGVPLTLVALALTRLRGARRGRAARRTAVAALPVFVLSSFLAARFDHDPADAAAAAEASADLAAIRRLTAGKTVYFPKATVDLNPWRAHRNYWLHGRVLVREDARRLADVVVAPRIAGVASLTPGARRLFLYRPAPYFAGLAAARAPYERIPQDHEPVIATGHYDVYFTGGALLYVGRRGCALDRDLYFFLHVIPLDADDLPRPRRRHGYDNLQFRGNQLSWRNGGKCHVVRRLPEYGIAEVRTGQYRWRDRKEIWSGSLQPPRDAPPAPVHGASFSASQ